MITSDSIRSQLELHRDDLDRFGVAGLWLFGSIARDEARTHDLDLMVAFRKSPTLSQFMGLKFFLEELFGMPVDLVTRSSCPDRFLRRIEADLKHVA